MNGKRYFLDTNAIIELLKGNKKLLSCISDASYIACSIVTVLEYKVFSGLSNEDIALFNTLLKKINTINLNYDDHALIQQILNVRKNYNLKLPDAIIVGSSENNNCILITADKKILNVEKIQSINFV